MQGSRLSCRTRSTSPVSSITDFHSVSSRMTLRDDFLQHEGSRQDSADTINAIRYSDGSIEKDTTPTSSIVAATCSPKRYYKDELQSSPEGALCDREIETSVTTPSAENNTMSPWHEKLFVFNVSLAQVISLASLATTIAPVLVIGESFGVHDLGQSSWWVEIQKIWRAGTDSIVPRFTAAYSMTLGTFILPAGRLGDNIGHKKVFIFGWCWFSAWSVVCGFSYTGGPISKWIPPMCLQIHVWQPGGNSAIFRQRYAGNWARSVGMSCYETFRMPLC